MLKGTKLQSSRLFAVAEQSIPPTPLPQSGYVRLPCVLRYAGLSKSTWYKGMIDGLYPKQIRIGRRAVGWDVEDLRRWKETNKAP